MTTPHQRRMSEVEAMRGLIADLEALIESSKGTIPTASVAAAFEKLASQLPSNSALLGQLQGLAAKLRAETSPQLAESRVRQVAVTLRRRSGDMGRWVDARDKRLSAKRNQG